MRFPQLARKIHAWGLTILFAPLLLIAATGTLLQVKKHFDWIQPGERAGVGAGFELTPAQVLDACRKLPEADIASWEDVTRIDVRPTKSLIKITSGKNWEVQLDAVSGRILSSAPRRSDWLESLHDGSWFGDIGKFGVFLPTGVMLVVGLMTGVYLFALPWFVRQKRRPNLPPSATSPAHRIRAAPAKDVPPSRPFTSELVRDETS